MGKKPKDKASLFNLRLTTSSKEKTDKYKIEFEHITAACHAMLSDLKKQGININYYLNLLKSIQKTDQHNQLRYLKSLYSVIKTTITKNLSDLLNELKDLDCYQQFAKREISIFKHSLVLIDKLLLIENSEIHFFDIKPANFLVTNTGELVLVDTKSVTNKNRSKDSVNFSGHIHYQPRELAQGFLTNSGRIKCQQASNLASYQLGCCLYDLIAGKQEAHMGYENNVIALLDSGYKKTFNFDLPQFTTKMGEFYKQVISRLSNSVANDRISIATVKELFSIFQHRQGTIAEEKTIDSMPKNP